MIAKNLIADTAGGRQSAYIARNRAALIRAGQEILASVGLNATIEQIADFSQVSPTTFYKYFDTKEAFFSAALDEIWREWVIWAYNGNLPGSSLEASLDTARKLFWVKKTHPLFAKVLFNTLSNPSFVLQSVRGGAEPTFRALAKRGAIKGDEFEKRSIMSGYALLGLLVSVHVTGELTPKEGEAGLAMLLSVWGVSESEAENMISTPLVFAPVK
jgi:AcrR family transcriptional regulator